MPSGIAPLPRALRAWSRAALAAVLLALAMPVAANAAERPIVYVVVIDALDPDRVDAGGTPFISSLLAGQGARAAYYDESRSIMLSTTNPNHVAMMTGAYGETSGFLGNAFALYAPLEDEESCAATGPEDFSRLPTETSGENANCLLAETVFAAIRRQGNPDGLATAAIFGKPKLASIFAGSQAGGDWRDVDHLWAPCTDEEGDEDYCEPVPLNPATGYGLEDGATMTEVLRTIDEGIEAGGERRRPDLTLVNLHQTDSAGHGFGTDSGPYDLAIGVADQQLQRLVTRLRERGEWDRTIMLLVSDHSMDTALHKVVLTSRFTAAGIPEDAFLPIARIGEGGADLIYLADRTSEARFELLARMRRIALATDGVDEALYREPNPADGGSAHTVGQVHPSWRIGGPRGPDLVVTPEAGVAFSESSELTNPIPGNHGGPVTRDSFFAVIGGSDAVVHGRRAGERGARLDDTEANPRQAENVDVASTVMGIFGLAETRQDQGRFLAEALDRSRVPGATRPAAPRLTLRGRRRGARYCSYSAEWTPSSGTFDVQIRSGRRWGRVRSRRTTDSVRFRGRTGRRYTVRVRSRAASGAHSPWSAARFDRRCR